MSLITTLNSSDSGATSRTVINTNFANLNAGKAETASPSFSGTSTFSGEINEAQGADIASATTTDLGVATGNYVRITGTTTITGLGTIQAGTRRVVTFTGTLTLTHNATSLILPGGASITTATGDSAEFISLGSGNWRCTSYVKADGTPIVSSTPTISASSGLTTHSASSTTTKTIAHGLGRTPTQVNVSGSTSGLSNAFYSGVYTSLGGNAGVGIGNLQYSDSSTYAVLLVEGFSPDRNQGAITVDSTNITITWTKLGSPSQTWSIVWSAQ